MESGDEAHNGTYFELLNHPLNLQQADYLFSETKYKIKLWHNLKLADL